LGHWHSAPIRCIPEINCYFLPFCRGGGKQWLLETLHFIIVKAAAFQGFKFQGQYIRGLTPDTLTWLQLNGLRIH
jgi:hypothetical protein